MNKVWTQEEKDFIRQNSAYMRDKDMAEAISKIRGKKVSVQALRKQRAKLGINKMGGRGNFNLVKQQGTQSHNIARVIKRNN